MAKGFYGRFIDLLVRWDVILNPVKFLYGFRELFRYIGDYLRYVGMEGAEDMKFMDSFPCLRDNTKEMVFDRHYFYQDTWAFRKIRENKVAHHVDVASRIDFAGFLSSITKVTYVDIRILRLDLKNIEFKKGDLYDMPFKDGAVPSLSCLHVAEHIGLGRYGDALDPLGTRKAVKELARILAPGGDLYFSLPVGRPRVCFNAHRIHSPRRILEYFDGLKLVEFSGVSDDLSFREKIDVDNLENEEYGCGLFWFRKPA